MTDQAQPKDYVVKAQTKWEELKAAIDAEFVKQNRRVNRSSETRLRGLLRDITKDVYVGYRDASLADAKSEEANSTTTTTEATTVAQ